MTDKDKDKSGNLSAGLVVDSGVTDPFIFEFYRKYSVPLLLICSTLSFYHAFLPRLQC